MFAAQKGRMIGSIRLKPRRLAWRWSGFGCCLAAPILLASCGSGGWPPPWVEPTGALAAAEVASITVFGRGIVDILFSGFSGRDCSIVYLDRGQGYCREQEPPPAPPPYCTRSLGRVDCWANPEAMSNRPPQVADGPMTLTPAQEANRTRRWPPL